MTPVAAYGDTRPVTILVAALGGQGGGVLAEWLVDAASRAGFPAQSTSIPGVAQRTGATTYYIEIFPVPRAALGGREPVLSLLPVPGAIDLLVASELLEGGRMVQAGYVDEARTMLITSTSRTFTTAEKMALGDGRYASERLVDVARARSRQFVGFDMDAAARDSGTIVSAVMLGAIAASGALPFGADACLVVVDASGAGADASRRGFSRGFEATRTALALPATPLKTTGVASRAPATVASAFAHELAAFPASCRDIVAHGIERVVDFQDDAYARLYLARLSRVRDVEAATDPRAGHGVAVTRETARFLALWMAFDDIVRVADLKGRASRHVRVRREAGARDGDVVRVADYFKPGIPEIAGLLPPWLARRLAAWDRRRQARGRAAFALPLTVRTDAVGGMVALRVLASLRGWRRRGARYAEEQAAIERWLDAIVAALAQDWATGYEIALAGRLVKGYGATNLRGKRNLAHLLDHLAAGPFATPADRARAIRDAREAALADESGLGLDAALVRHGAPARPVVAQPIRWMNKQSPVANAPGSR
ncbi:MAG: indolepyruvate oxidoreductase subunit beta family protein [Betaproteobacteria bacterium]